MTGHQDDLFGAVDALLEQAAPLPHPAERERLRTAGDLSRADIAKALGVSTSRVTSWETGKSHPAKELRAAYGRLLEGLAQHYPTPSSPQAGSPDGDGRQDVPQALTEPEGVPGDVVHAQPAPSADAVSAGIARTGPSRSRPPSRRAAPCATAAATAADGRFSRGPLGVLDGDGAVYCAGGVVLDCPATTIPALVEWTLATSGIGAPRLHRHGRDADPLIVLTAAAAHRFGLPDRLTDRKGLRLGEEHPVVGEITAAGWQLTRRGFGPWARIYRPAEGGRRQCVQLAVLPWDALDARAWGEVATWPAAEVARVLGLYATRVLTPRGSTAVTGLELMTALRPPTRPARNEAAGGWTSGMLPGSLTHPVDPAPPEAPPEHPAAAGRDVGQVLDEEAYEWTRDAELLTDAECALPWVVGLDVNMAFAAAANRLTVGLGPPVHTDGPRFDKKLPGCWYADLSHIQLDERLPSPFTPHGGRPPGPAWYATPTLAYAQELGYEVRPLQAWLRPEAGPYLDPWYERLRDAYLATMADLGVTKDLDDTAFLAAMEHHKHADPGAAAALSAIKATVKGGIGKLRERPQGARYRPGERWPALQRPTWRPDIRAAVIAQARTNMHRKMRTMAAAGHFPLAVLSDCVLYPSPGHSVLDLLPRDAAGKPLPGTFRLGVSPGQVKPEGQAKPLWWAAGLLEDGANPARHIKDDLTEGEE